MIIWDGKWGTKRDYSLTVDNAYIESKNGSMLREAIESGKLTEAQVDICIHDERQEVQILTAKLYDIPDRTREEILSLDNDRDASGKLRAAVIEKGGLEQDRYDCYIVSSEQRIRMAALQSGELSPKNYETALTDQSPLVRKTAIEMSEKYGGLTPEQYDRAMNDSVESIRQASEKATVREPEQALLQDANAEQKIEVEVELQKTVQHEIGDQVEQEKQVEPENKVEQVEPEKLEMPMRREHNDANEHQRAMEQRQAQIQEPEPVRQAPVRQREYEEELER